MEYSHKTDAHLVKHKQHKTQCETLGGELQTEILYPEKKLIPLPHKFSKSFKKLFLETNKK